MYQPTVLLQPWANSRPPAPPGCGTWFQLPEVNVQTVMIHSFFPPFPTVSPPPVHLGVGYGQIIANASVVSYYTSLIALSLYYLVASCQSALPWMHCDPNIQVRKMGGGGNFLAN